MRMPVSFMPALLLLLAAHRPATAGDSFALRAAVLHPVSPQLSETIPNGVIIVRDGRIVAVGADVEIPADLPLIDLPHAHVCPGFVDAAGSGRHSGPESIGAAYHAVDAINRYADNGLALARGTTTTHFGTGIHRLVSGVGAVTKLAGPAAERVLIDHSDLNVTLGVFGAPELIDVPFYASSDVPIEPATAQRPASRVSQLPALQEALAGSNGEAFDPHGDALRRWWKGSNAVRIHARRAVDLRAALGLLRERTGYLVGGTQVDAIAEEFIASGVPLVLRLEDTYNRATFPLGNDPDALAPDVRVISALKRAVAEGRSGRPLRMALAGRDGEPVDLRMIALQAMRGGLDHHEALAAITRVPAEILGVGDRVGSLAPGRDADFLVLGAPPLEPGSQVLSAWVNGHEVYKSKTSSSLVVRAGTIWTGERVIHDGAVLLHDGKVAAVGQRVPVPAGARWIDAGPEAFVTPGYIDAHGHLGLENDRSRVGPDVPIARDCRARQSGGAACCRGGRHHGHVGTLFGGADRR